MTNEKRLRLVSSPDGWFEFNREKNWEVNEFLKDLPSEDEWEIRRPLKTVFKDMEGIIKVSLDNRNKEIRREYEKLQPGIYGTIKVINFRREGSSVFVKIKMINNFFKDGNIITKEEAIAILGKSLFNAQSQGYITKEQYERICNMRPD